jgi:hypothetical protein
MNPVLGIAGGVCEPLEFAHGFGKHRSLVLLADDPVSELVFLQQGWRKSVITEAPPPLQFTALVIPP